MADPQLKWYTKQNKKDGKWYRTQASSPDEATSKLEKAWSGTGTGASTVNNQPMPHELTFQGVKSRISGNVTQPLEAAKSIADDILTGKNPLRGGSKPSPEHLHEVMPWGTSPLAATAGVATYPARATIGGLYQAWKDPNNLVGDVATGIILHEASGAPESARMRQAAKATSDAVEHSANVDATVKATGRQIPESTQAQVPKWMTDMTPTERAKFDKLPPEDQAKFREKAEANLREHAAKVGDYEDQVRLARDKANTEHAQAIRDYAETESKRRAEWARKQYGYNQAQYEKVAAENKKQLLELGSREYTRLARENMQAVHKAVRESLDTRWNKLRGDMQGAQVSDPATIYNRITAAEQEFLRGSPQSLQQFRNLMREMGIKDFAEREDGTLEAISPDDSEGAKPLPWETARVHYTAIGDRLAAGNLPGNVYQALKSVHEELGNQLQQMADQSGKGSEYSTLRGDWSQYMKDWKDISAPSGGGSPLARALRSPDIGYVYQQVNGLAGDRMIQSYSRYRSFGANPDLLNKARQFGSEAKAVKIPTVKAKPGEFERTTAPALETPKMPKFPEFNRPEVPEPSKQPLPATLRAGGRLAGKAAGFVGGGVVGHPFAGWAAGGEVGEALIRRWWEGRQPKPGI